MVKKLVIAGTFAEYVQWCKENEIPTYGVQASYVANAEVIEWASGRPFEIVKYGTWYNRRDLHMLDEAIAQARI